MLSAVHSYCKNAIFYTHDINTGISGFNKINIDSKDSINLQKLGETGGDAKEAYAGTLNHDRKVEVIRLDDYVESIDPNLHIDFSENRYSGF